MLKVDNAIIICLQFLRSKKNYFSQLNQRNRIAIVINMRKCIIHFVAIRKCCYIRFVEMFYILRCYAHSKIYFYKYSCDVCENSENNCFSSTSTVWLMTNFFCSSNDFDFSFVLSSITLFPSRNDYWHMQVRLIAKISTFHFSIIYIDCHKVPLSQEDCWGFHEFIFKISFYVLSQMYVTCDIKKNLFSLFIRCQCLGQLIIFH